jgi:hypothetical protein
MKTVKEVIAAINEAKTCDPCDIEEIVDEANAVELETLNRDEHRWYVVGTTVYKLGDEFFGVHGVVGLKSENMGYIDACIDYVAFEMEAVPSVTYRVKKQ